ncbi:unnamed protein product [Musa acuminata var. zebrina]
MQVLKSQILCCVCYTSGGKCFDGGQSVGVPQRLSPLDLKTTGRQRAPPCRPEVSPRAALQVRKKGTMVADKKTRLSTAREELTEEKPQRENKSMDAFEVVSREEEKMTAIERRNDDEGDAAVAAEEEEKESKAVAVLPVSPEVDHLKVKLLEKEKEAEILVVENAILKTNAEAEAKKMAGAARAKEAELMAKLESTEEELMAKLESTEEELKASRAKADRLAEQLEAAEGAKTALEAEMRRLRAQTEQWRKAAEAGAAALDAEGRSCGSMDKRLEAWHVGWGSPLMAGDMDDDGAGGAACGGMMKGGGVWTVVDIWKKKKKGQQQ